MSGIIQLPENRDRYQALSKAVEQIPGLHIAEAGFGVAEYVVLIGWNRQKVSQMASNMDKQVNITRPDSSWNRVAQLDLKHQAKLRGPASYPFEPCNTCGIYAVRCQFVEDFWPILAKDDRLRIIRGGHIASFDFGILTGVMVLAEKLINVSRLVADAKCIKPIDGGVYGDDFDDEAIRKPAAIPAGYTYNGVDSIPELVKFTARPTATLAILISRTATQLSSVVCYTSIQQQAVKSILRATGSPERLDH